MSQWVLADSLSLLSQRVWLQDSELIALFDCPATKVLKVANKPPLLGGKIKEVSAEQFAQDEKVQWTEAVMGNSALRQIIQSNSADTKLSDLEKQLQERMQNSLDLVISDIDPAVGKGVFLSTESPVIKKGTIMVLYAGQLGDSYKRDFDPDFNPYEIQTGDSPIFEDQNNNNDSQHGFVSGLKFRNGALV